MTDWRVTTVRTGRSMGAMTWRQVRQGEAPSSAAASSTSPGMAGMPA